MTQSGAFGRLFSFFAAREKWYSDYATVVSVDESSCTCVVNIKNGVTGMRSRRVASLSNSGAIVVTPAIGSRVVVSYTSRKTCYVSMYSSVSSIMLISGDHGGLVDVKELVKKLNTLENRMSTHQHMYVSSGAVAITTVDPATNATITPTVETDISNDKITH